MWARLPHSQLLPAIIVCCIVSARATNANLPPHAQANNANLYGIIQDMIGPNSLPEGWEALFDPSNGRW